MQIFNETCVCQEKNVACMEAILISNSAWYGDETWCKNIIGVFFAKKSPHSTLRKCTFEPNQTSPNTVDL
jgi:hypothetical protein